jgi:hypothetical protein
MVLEPEKVSERPTEFSSKGGSMRGIFTLKRQVAEKVGEVRRFEGHQKWVPRVAFSRDGRRVISSGEAAAELGISRNAALVAKSRVLSRGRAELAGLID